MEDELFSTQFQGRTSAFMPGASSEGMAQKDEASPGDFVANDLAMEKATDSGGFIESMRKNKLWLAAGALTVASTVASVANVGWHELVHRAGEVASWVAPSLAATEAAWIGGAAMALTAAGKKVRNILRVRREFAHIEQDVEASDVSLSESRLFRAGLAVNTAGALGAFGVVTAAVLKMPTESWGLLSLGAVDLAGTIAARTAIWKAAQPRQSEGDAHESLS